MAIWRKLALLSLAAVVGAGFLTANPMPADAKRLALIIGISEYKNMSTLPNPARDARAVAGMLRQNGFQVSEHYNLSRADFLDALEEFQDQSKAAELAVVYYAGHGLELNGRDILAPSDLKVTCEPKTVKRSVRLDKLFEAASGATNQVILLDSCRSDPFPQCPTRSAQSGSGFRGLSRVTSDRGSMLIANATLSGQLAADGTPGEHSPFAKALMTRFSKSPNAYFRDVLEQVAQDVRTATNGAQVPEVTSRGGSPRMCLSGSECGQLASLQPQTETPARRQDSNPNFGREFAVGDTFKDCDDCPQMTVVPAGAFTMGSLPSEPGRSATEGPPVQVRIAKPFAVSKLEITYDQWQTCALEGGCNAHRPKDSGWGKGPRPVTYVSWDDARAYVEWLREKTGKRYRLLTEAEWEYAARAGTTTAFATGNRITTAQANFDGSGVAGTRGEYRGKTTEAGSFGPNPFGLHDTHGNVAEWVQDCWNQTHAGAPGDGSARGGTCSRRVVKGGAWYFEPSYARSAARMSFPKGKRLNIVGFRVARSLD